MKELLITTTGINTRFKGIAASHDLNEFGESVVRDLASMHSFAAETMVTSKRIMDVMNAQVASMQAVVNSLAEASLDLPSTEINVDFFVPASTWVTTGAQLNGMDHHCQYRLLVDPAKCAHNPFYGQITLPYTSEEDKALLRGSDTVMMPDSLKVTTRIFRIHSNEITRAGRTYKYFDPDNYTNPFNLEAIVRDAKDALTDETIVNPELNIADIQATFEQTDPLFAMDGDNTTPAWYFVPIVDIDQVLPPWSGDPAPATSHLVVFYDIELPQDINSNMFMNVIQIHPVPMYKMNLVDVRYSVGVGFDDGALGQQFNMLQGIAGSSAMPVYGAYNYQPGNTITTTLGAGPNIFWNMGMLELHVKRTELNFLRLVFTCEYHPAMAATRQVALGATHVGVYQREYQPTGSFIIEFDEDTASAMTDITDNTSLWVNNLYALFNPDPASDIRTADVTDAGDGRLQIVFGIRTDDLTGTIQRFDNSATPSFNRVIVK